MGVSLDELIQKFNLPIPDHIKVDVDGFEHKVIYGAKNLLLKSQLKSICIELNTNLPEHNEIISHLNLIGFFCMSSQVNKSMRQTGPFKGCSEFIFQRSLSYSPTVATALGRGGYPNEPFAKVPSFLAEHCSAFRHAAQRLIDQPISNSPFPNLFVEDIFPQKYFENIRSYFPGTTQMATLASQGRVSPIDENKSKNGCLKRFATQFTKKQFNVLDDSQKLFWLGFNELLTAPFFINILLSKFDKWLSPRLLNSPNTPNIHSDSLLIRDLSSYEIGPHTDHPQRLISLLFYMPDDDSFIKYGTSLYTPKQEGFICEGGPHYKVDAFNNVGTVPFKPNSLFLFCKTNWSFHGVEKINEPFVERKLIINNLRVE